jgi:hypothetical protein
MVKLRKIAHRAVDVVSDRVDHLVTALENNVQSPVVPERVRALGSGSGVDLVGDLTVVEGFDDGGAVSPDFSHTGVPLLDSFFFQFTNDDHHLTAISITPDRPQGKIFLQFQDKNGDDDYFYKVIHRIVNDSRVQQFSTSSDICSENVCTVELPKPAGDFIFVLIGFSLRFTGDDHHVKVVDIHERRGSLSVTFRDKQTAPPPIFLWDVQYAYVPRDLFVELGRSDGRGDRGGAGRDISAGPSVICGFSFRFVDDDHHLRDIGVTTPDNGRVEVFYEDHNSDDAFNWSVDWGILTT